MAAALRLAIDRTVADQVLECLEAVFDLGMQRPCSTGVKPSDV